MTVYARSMLILVAGPYRSGTDDKPERIAANMRAMNEAALAVYRRGHLPITGEAIALPLIELAGSKTIGDAVFNEIFHPMAERLLKHCDGCLRIGGASAGADLMVRTAREAGLAVFLSIDNLPTVMGSFSWGRFRRAIASL